MFYHVSKLEKSRKTEKFNKNTNHEVLDGSCWMKVSNEFLVDKLLIRTRDHH